MPVVYTSLGVPHAAFVGVAQKVNDMVVKLLRSMFIVYTQKGGDISS